MKELTPRERQAIFRSWVKVFLQAFVIALIICILFVIAISMPTDRDSYEATKAQRWQSQVREYKNAHSQK